MIANYLWISLNDRSTFWRSSSAWSRSCRTRSRSISMRTESRSFSCKRSKGQLYQNCRLRAGSFWIRWIRKTRFWHRSESVMPNRVADPRCLSRILIFIHPGSRISYPGSNNTTKREGEKIFFFLPFLVATNIIKLKIILFLNRKEIFFCQNTKNYSTLYPKIWH